MKTTKLIKEYIADEVSKKYQPLIDAAEKERKDNPCKKVTSETMEELKAIAIKVWRERLAPYYASEDLEAMLVCTTLIGEPHKYSVRSIPETKCIEKLDKLRSARDKAIKDILITMELGGNKADLDDMLSKIKPEV